MTLEQRIDNTLGPWPTPDQTREAFLLLARHLQRHDELVTLQRDIDAYATDRRMPDDALDSFEAQRDALRREIWEETVGRLAEGGAGQCEAAADNAAESLDLEAIESRAQRLMIATWECDRLSYTDQWQLTSCDVPALVAEVRRLHAERDAANKRIKELEEEVADKEYAEVFTRRGLEAKLSFQKNLAEKRVEIIEQLNRRIQELEDGAAKANELIHLYKNQRDENEREAQECGDVCLALEDKLARAYDVMSGGRISKPETDFETVYAVYQSEVLDELTRLESEVAEHRRHVATVMQREDALKKRVEELEDERDDAKEQATSLASLARVSKALAAKRAETIAAQQQHIEVLNRRLAERDADAEVGKAIRELRPKKGHIRIMIEQIIMIHDGSPRYRMTWRAGSGEWHTGWHCSSVDAIHEYNERED